MDKNNIVFEMDYFKVNKVEVKNRKTPIYYILSRI